MTNHESYEHFNLEKFARDMTPTMRRVKNDFFGKPRQIAYLKKVAEDIEKRIGNSDIVSGLEVAHIMKHPTGYREAAIINELKNISIHDIPIIILTIFSIAGGIWLILTYFHIIKTLKN